MKKILFTLIIAIGAIGSYCQDYSYVNADKGVSHDNSVKNKNTVSIPLYTVKDNGVSIPIYLTYNSRGMKSSNIPSSVGFNWKLHAGGSIEKEINHLLDESENGWFFNDQVENLQLGYGQGQIFKSIDVTPDLFKMRMSNGENMDFYYERSASPFSVNPIIANGTKKISSHNIYTNFGLLSENSTSAEDNDYYNNDDEAEISIKNDNGVNYLFRKGVKRELPWDLSRPYSRVDSLYYQNYYIHKIYTDSNSKSIHFEYLDSPIYKLISHTEGGRYQTNSDDRTPPESSDPIVSGGFYQDISLEDQARKDISKIITDKETIIFTYKTESLFNSTYSITGNNNFSNQDIKLLDEIKIYDHDGNYISGYHFFYTEETQSQEPHEGGLLLKYISKYGKNHKNSVVYKKFNYNYGSRESSASTSKDVLGYPNGAFQNSQCNEIPILDCFNRMPNESVMVQGMLKSVINQNGGRTEYTYQENKSGIMYYGGLLVNSVSSFDINDNLIYTTNYTYENPEGFGLPIYDETYDIQNGEYTGQIPTNSYDDGFFEIRLATHAWQTYFTKIDPAVEDNSLPYLTGYLVRDVPYALQKTGATIQAQLDSFQLVDYDQHEAGAYYKKVTQTSININTTLADKGYIVSTYRPSLTGFYLDKKLEKIEYFNNDGIIVKEKRYNYEIVNLGYSDAFKFDNVHFSSNIYNSSFNYNLKSFPIYKMKDVLRSSEVIEYGDDIINDVKTQKNLYTYLNENDGNINTNDYNRIKNIQKYFNNSLKTKTEFKYLSEYSNISQELDNFRLTAKNPIVEENEWIQSESTGGLVLYSSVVNWYLPDGKIERKGFLYGNPLSTASSFISSYYDTNFDLISLAEDFIEYEYDINGLLVVEKNLKTNVNTILQRSDEYASNYIDAILTTTTPYTSSSNFFLKKSFENKNEIGVLKFDKAFSGDYVLGGSSISLGDFPNGYEVSYWVYINGVWNIESYIHTGGVVVVNKPSSALYLDEIRIQPQNSILEGFSFNPLIGRTSSLNARGDGERIEYDIFNRPLYLLNKESKVLKEYRYNSLDIQLPF